QFADMTIPAPKLTDRIVPLLVGLSQPNAIAALAAVNLLPGTIGTANSATIPIGFVLSQSVNAGLTVTAGSTVDFVVSLGALVPDLTGLTEARAPLTLREAGLVPGTVTHVNSNTVPAGLVISQNPFAAGASVEVGSVENFVVSLGPAQVAV